MGLNKYFTTINFGWNLSPEIMAKLAFLIYCIFFVLKYDFGLTLSTQPDVHSSLCPVSCSSKLLLFEVVMVTINKPHVEKPFFHKDDNV